MKTQPQYHLILLCLFYFWVAFKNAVASSQFKGKISYLNFIVSTTTIILLPFLQIVQNISLLTHKLKSVCLQKKSVIYTCNRVQKELETDLQ